MSLRIHIRFPNGIVGAQLAATGLFFEAGRKISRRDGRMAKFTEMEALKSIARSLCSPLIWTGLGRLRRFEKCRALAGWRSMQSNCMFRQGEALKRP